jgi:hypothetical protein
MLPINVLLLAQLINVAETGEHLDITAMFYYSVAFFGRCRYDDVKNIRFIDVSFNIDYLCINLKVSKTDKTAVGKQILLDKLDNAAICPWLLANFSSFAPSHLNYSAEFSVFTPTRNGKFLNRKSSYAEWTKKLRIHLIHLVPNVKLFSLHLFRAGGATSAANSGFQQTNIANHGR